MKTNNQTYYYITDRLGSVRYVLDETGAIVNSYTYTPFGQIHSSSGSLNQPYRYVGGEFYYTEEDTGLKLLGQRWYDAEVGRFISRDPIGEEGGKRVFGQINLRIKNLKENYYLYCHNQPINYKDPKGLSTEEDCRRWYERYINDCNEWFKDCIKECRNLFLPPARFICIYYGCIPGQIVCLHAAYTNLIICLCGVEKE